MATMIWIGALVSLLGLGGVVYSIVTVTRAKRANLSDEALRAKVGAMMPINLGSFFAAMLGLMMVLVGVLLG